MLAGIATNTIFFGVNGFIFSITGCLVPVLLLIIFFALRMLGAGDIKLFAAIGSIMGLEFVLYNMAYSFLAGGVIALGILTVNRNGAQRFRHLWRYLKSCFLTLSLQPYTNFEDKSDRAKFRFSYAVACGTAFSCWLLAIGC